MAFPAAGRIRRPIAAAWPMPQPAHYAQACHSITRPIVPASAMPMIVSSVPPFPVTTLATAPPSVPVLIPMRRRLATAVEGLGIGTVAHVHIQVVIQARNPRAPVRAVLGILLPAVVTVLAVRK